MSRVRANSSPNLAPATDFDMRCSTFGGIAVEVKLLLKLIQDHMDASKEDDGRKPQRIAGMMTILDDVKARIQKSAEFPSSKPELRRCNTELRRGTPPTSPKDEKKPPQDPADESQRLRRELSASVSARKSLERMFQGVGKEKAIMAAELAKKVQALSSMQEHIGELQAENEMLSEKVKTCTAEHRARKNGDVAHGSTVAALQERNKTLSDQLLKALDGYRSMKRRCKDAQEENGRVLWRMAEAAGEVAAGGGKIRGLREGRTAGIEEELLVVERMLVGLQGKLANDGPKKSERTEKHSELEGEAQ